MNKFPVYLRKFGSQNGFDAKIESKVFEIIQNCFQRGITIAYG